MLCRTLLTETEDTQVLSSESDPCYNSADLTGYVTEEGTIFFTEVEPKYCPKTGKPLQLVEYLPGESLHDLV